MLVLRPLAEIYSELEVARTHEDLFENMRSFTELIEFDQYLYSTVPEYFTHSKTTPPPIMTTNFDSDWMDFYFHERFDLNDAGLAYCLKNQDPRPFVWSERVRHLSEREKFILSTSKEALGETITIPIHNCPGALSVVSFNKKTGSEKFYKAYENVKASMVQYIYAFNEVMLEFHSAYYGNLFYIKLTESEKDVFKYLANGYSRKEIANLRFKAQGTIDKQINSAMRKLKARNIVHAVVLALKWRLLK